MTAVVSSFQLYHLPEKEKNRMKKTTNTRYCEKGDEFFFFKHSFN